MNDLKKDFDIVKRCPKCNGLSLSYEKGRIRCNECGFEQAVADIN